MRARAETERGSALALVPAGFLVLIVLAAIAVDSASSYLAQRQLQDTLAAAATDAATNALSNNSYYRSGAVRVDPATAAQSVCLDVLAQGGTDLHDLKLWMAVSADSVRLEGSATIDAVFGRVVPGFGRTTVRADAQAVVSSGPGTGPAPGRSSPPSGPLVPVNCG